MPATLTVNTNAVHILDPTHSFTAMMASKTIEERRKSEMILSLFVLARRTGAALVKNIHRDIETLGRLSGISMLSPKHEGMRWWRKQIGAPYASIPKEVWKAAVSMATEDLQARGFVVHKFELYADPELLKIQWKLAVRHHS
ncbi:protein of unknown function [Taphrina deformans PYCC 5710]|uniref:Uncharacterized protein n=1 Tax=Taphrina deformans (strain PYCC 5710 / ATCC 11124 / CBS 356.35 / IMI 108563 / JCM 9778 / NBRC 8474) TaxID=1097556 RepID=R4XEM5_TAPDE|nr:protein of unknown function [Taphrina deformans PYCC 5710]|eukprot:CCG84226.1 protein of unknown function [Taphrina deformans PYCC 5710]